MNFIWKEHTKSGERDMMKISGDTQGREELCINSRWNQLLAAKVKRKFKLSQGKSSGAPENPGHEAWFSKINSELRPLSFRTPDTERSVYNRAQELWLLRGWCAHSWRAADTIHQRLSRHRATKPQSNPQSLWWRARHGLGTEKQPESIPDFSEPQEM